MARLIRKSVRLPVTLALAAAAAAVAGCATAPSGGPPRSAPGGNSQVQAYVQPLPPPGPTSNWTPKEVVLGFLHASASYAFDPAAARQYLVPEQRHKWQPGRGPVAVVSSTPSVTQLPYFPKQSLGSGQSAASAPQWLVTVSGPQVASLSQSGQYQYAQGENVQYQFVLARTNGVWLIQQLPAQQGLMLTESDFQEVYQPRNLFFFAPPPANDTPIWLVPDPVYAPLQSANSALNTDLATGLVNGLLKGQGGWLSGATISAFPPGTRLLKKVTITGKIAYVDLAAAHAHNPVLMAYQLAQTLGDGAYALPLASRVQLTINGRQYPPIGNPGLVPQVPSGPIELVTGTSSVGELSAQPAHAAKVQSRLTQDQIGPGPVTAVAASPSSDHPQQLAVAIEKSGGCAIEEQPGSQGAYQTYPLTTSGGSCTSLSYDPNGNLWVSAGSGIWVLPAGLPANRPPVAVDLSAMSAALQPGDKILALQMAPDAVRVALLVSTPAGNRLLLAAAHLRGGGAVIGQPVTVGAGLSADPLAISWFNSYNLAVLVTSGIYEVPLTTGAAQQPAPQLLTTAPTGVQPTTMTTDGAELVVGTSQGQVYAEALSSPGWSSVTNGTDPVYPG